MNEAQRQVLEMLKNGTISAEEANKLLAAMGADDAADSDTAAPEAPPEPPAAPVDPAPPQDMRDVLEQLQAGTLSAEQANSLLAEAASDEADAGYAEPAPIDEVVMPDDMPDMDHFRRFWQMPFFVAVGFLILSGMCMTATYGTAGFFNTLGFICGWSVFMVAVLAIVAVFWSRNARWMHIRVQEKAGKRINISLPVPLGLLEWGVKFAQPFVKGKTGEQLEMSAEFLKAMREEMSEPGAEPFVINVNDEEDGDQVLIYFG